MEGLYYSYGSSKMGTKSAGTREEKIISAVTFEVGPEPFEYRQSLREDSEAGGAHKIVRAISTFQMVNVRKRGTRIKGAESPFTHCKRGHIYI